MNFYSRWADVVKEFSNEHSPNGHFEQYTVFAYDWFQTKYGLASTFLYTGVLAIYTSQLSSTTATRGQVLLVIGVALLGLAVASAFLVDRWFNKENYQPETYYRYFYRDGGSFNEPTSEKVMNRIADQYRSKWISPPKVTLASEILLILIAIWIVF